jgi:hypothetical protein
MKLIPKNLVLVLLVAAIAPLSAFGCGSNDDDGDTSAPLTKAAFLKKGNQICQKRLDEKDAAVKTAVKKSQEEEEGTPSKQRQEEVANDILTTYQELTKELDELPPPENSEAKADDLVAELESGIEKAEANPLTLLRVNLFEEASQAARANGLETCNF